MVCKYRTVVPRKEMNGILSAVNRHPFISLFIYCLSVCVTTVLFADTAIYFAIALTAVYILCTVSVKRGKITASDIIHIAAVLGVLLRTFYIIYTPVDVRQHDVALFGIPEWKNNVYHSGYIEYILSNGTFPDIDISVFTQYYHPPLHHVISACFLKLSDMLGVVYGTACESLQVLTLFYASCASALAIKTVKALGFSDRACLVAAILLSAHPSLIIMSGSVNNDILSVCLAFAAFYTAVKWYKKQRIGTILLCAVFMGCAMMTKLSAALIAPAIAVMFISIFIQRIKEKNGIGSIISQFASFAAVCVPLGLWWQIRGLLKFGMPLGYVPYIAETSQLITDKSILQRLFATESESLSRIFVAWRNAYSSSFTEYNIFAGLFKTSVFGETPLFYSKDGATVMTDIGTALCHVLFWSAVLLAVALAISLIYIAVKRSVIYDKTVTVSLLVMCGTVLFSYISFCFGYPVTCTQNFRYCVPLIIFAAILCAKISDVIPCPKILKYLCAVPTVILSAASVAVYILLGGL